MTNPFELVTASKLTAEEAVRLWCDDKRLDRVKGKENCFINGHRGTGKSMLFRVLQYDCQKLLNPSTEPDFLAVYFSVRDTEFLTEEMDLFQDDSQRNLISESHFSLLITLQLLRLLRNDLDLVPAQERQGLMDLLTAVQVGANRFTSTDLPTLDISGYEKFLLSIWSALEAERLRIVHYVGLRMYERASFDGGLYLFDSLLGPLSDFLRERARKTLYVLIDDGDDLPESHTVVLNTWIARRRASVVFKVSTMFAYKTYETRSRSAIQHPHDFFQYDIATRYLSDFTEDYIGLLKDICEKRLFLAGMETSPGKQSAEEFFPEDVSQKTKLAGLEEVLRREYETKYPSGRPVRDHVYRHLTSEYMKQLNREHSLGNYTYASFRTLAILSSGLVRDFIICAQRMYDNASRHGEAVSSVPPNIQHDVVRKHADEVLEEILNFKQKRARDSSPEDWRSIRRLVEGLGSLYKDKMLSDDSERRVFSFAFQDEPGEAIERMLDLAVAEGYLMRGFISRKEGTGRRVLYVLTRRLAPAFNLDVSAYSGYLSLTSDRIKALMAHGPTRSAERVSDQPALFDAVEMISDFSGDTLDLDSKWVPISPEEAGL